MTAASPPQPNDALDALRTAARSHDQLQMDIDRLLRDLTLSFARWQVLDANRSVRGAASTAQLARHLGRSRQAVQRIVNDLADEGFVSVHANPHDKRSQCVALSAEGLKAYTEALNRINSYINARKDRSETRVTAPQAEGYFKPDLPSRTATPPPETTKRRTRAFEHVQEDILRQIRDGYLSTGSKLPPEREMAKSLGIGRSAIREALRSLEMAGILKFVSGPKGGAFVRESGSDGITSSIRCMLILGRLPLTDLLEVRASLLGQCARLGTARGTPEDFARLDANIDTLEVQIASSEDQLDSIAPATDFYRLAARASHNPLMELLVDSMADLVSEMLTTLRRWPRLDSVSARREMVSAMRQGQADDAERAIRTHSENTNLLLIAYGKKLMNGSPH